MTAIVEPAEPRIIHRVCGGVLAISGVSDTLRIGVSAETEEVARELFALSHARCLTILAAPDPGIRGS